ncbi:hypothetical protein B0J18DRAFT_250658 [Chaetomium sp. MPI-SDFR-AT-0129]|nr:hypothetical protein B0J18DRAFT_250658 [Chaetomium sp. MPI-SDFR-AT-0129]
MSWRPALSPFCAAKLSSARGSKLGLESVVGAPPISTRAYEVRSSPTNTPKNQIPRQRVLACLQHWLSRRARLPALSSGGSSLSRPVADCPSKTGRPAQQRPDPSMAPWRRGARMVELPSVAQSCLPQATASYPATAPRENPTQRINSFLNRNLSWKLAQELFRKLEPCPAAR